MEQITEIEETVKMLLEDTTTPRAVREKLAKMVSDLKEEGDQQTKIWAALEKLEDISSDVNIPAYVRAQLYGISSQLESIGNKT